MYNINKKYNILDKIAGNDRGISTFCYRSRFKTAYFISLTYIKMKYLYFSKKYIKIYSIISNVISSSRGANFNTYWH